MPTTDGTDNLWLARALFDLGGVQFGDFTLGKETVGSPLYINPRVLISEPDVLRRAVEVIVQETTSGRARLKPRVAEFDLVAGVPFGGLHLATVFSLVTGTPMIYARPPRTGGIGDIIEGRYKEGQRVLIIDDLITHGRSVLQTATLLEEAGLRVHDAIVLIDREQGASDRLKRHGVHLISILRVKMMLNYYLGLGQIDSDQFHRSIAFLDQSKPRNQEWSIDEPPADR